MNSATRSSSVAAAIPIAALAARLAAAQAQSSWGNTAWLLALAVPAAVACLWLRLDARSHGQPIGLAHYLGLVLLPAAFVPYYINQTRQRSARIRANLWFVLVSGLVIAASWLA